MENKEISIMGIIFILVLVIALYLDFKVNKTNNAYQVENYRSENSIPSWKKKKCRHVNNNKVCRWCRYYRYNKNDLQYYKN